MSFLFPSLLWIGLPLVAAPILLHLLNLRRQRRVPWAAMEFLLESEQRNRRWVNLQQWLLLASRVLAVLVVALMLAGPRIAGSLAAWFSADRAHHVIVLDDSYSMSDQGPRGSAWQNAKSVVAHVIDEATKSAEHRVSLFRSSAVARGETSPVTAVGRAELAGLAEQTKTWRVTETAAPLAPAIEIAARYAQQSTEPGPLVAYVVSDFRTRDLDPEDRFENPLTELAAAADAVHLTPATDGPHDNLAITGLRLLPGARVADLELAAEVEVANYGRRQAERVIVELMRDGQPISAVEVGEVPPRESATSKFAVRFEDAGDHTLMATIEADAVAADNRRRLALSLPAEREVLIADGSPGGHEGLAYAAALRPQGVATGWQPTRVGAGEIESIGALDRFAAVLILDPARFSSSAAKLITDYASSGGGVLLSLGPSADRRNLNRMLLAGAPKPLLPIRLDLPTQTPAPTEAAASDIVVTDHPLLRVFRGDRNSFLQLIDVSYYHSLAGDELKAGAVASLRSGAPLLIESEPGGPRVVCLLTSATRPGDAMEGWSNLGVSPVFPVLVNELAAYLAAPNLQSPSPVVGDAWSTVGLGLPSGEAPRVSKVTKDSGDGPALDSPRIPDRQGWYRVSQADGATPGRLLAVNVDAAEGDLAGLAPEQLAERFAGAGVSVTTLAELLRSDDEPSQASLARTLGLGLLALLVFEKLLAVRCSYHQPAPAGRAS